MERKKQLSIEILVLSISRCYIFLERFYTYVVQLRQAMMMMTLMMTMPMTSLALLLASWLNRNITSVR